MEVGNLVNALDKQAVAQQIDFWMAEIYSQTPICLFLGRKAYLSPILFLMAWNETHRFRR